MNLTPEEIAVGKENFFAAIGSPAVRQKFLLEGIRQGIASRRGLGPYYFGYGKSVPEPLRVGVVGTGDEGSVLMGAMNPEFIEVRSISDIRPFSRYRAFHGELGVPTRPGLLSVYGWKTEDEARRHVKVYGGSYEELIGNAKQDGLEAVVIALPLHLHAPAAIAAMQAGLHVITEKLMAHSVGQCKEMARTAKKTNLYLAVGHQRHYSILYDNAVELIRRGVLGEIHYIRAQWHRGNLPGHDSWQQPLPPGVKPEKASEQLVKRLKDAKAKLAAASGKDVAEAERRAAQLAAQVADAVLHTGKDPKTGRPLAEALGYESRKIADYDRPAIEELIRWRLWDRTGAGLMAELGSHQLDAASIFIAAMHGDKEKMPHPISVAATANRPLFPADRDIEDHVFCIFEFPAPGYNAKDPEAAKKKIGVQYASINGNGYGGYGETVLGTEGTLVLDREQDVQLYKMAPSIGKTRVLTDKKSGRAKLDAAEAGDERSAAIGCQAMLEAERGYAEELEHWAWCIRNAAPENQPHCHPKVALKDAVIALCANQAARKGYRIDFQESWFDPDDPATPDA